MGAGASSAAGTSSSPARHGNGGSTGANSDRTTGTNVSSGACSSMEQASRASGSSDYASPKHARHVVIQATELKPQPPKGGIIDKFRQRASQNNSSCDSSTTSRGGSQGGSQAGSQYGSEKSQASARARRRDEFDVDSEDEDLDGFIYDDDSTSEDEREDYVNAFSRKKKPVVGEDYSEFEGAAVRALTAGTRKGAVRRTRSSTTDDGDDEWDAEEERIRQLRHLRKHEDRAKAAALAAKAAEERAAGNSRATGAGQPAVAVASSSSSSPAAAAAASTSGCDCASPQRPQPSLATQGPRISPQPPQEPQARTTSGNLRRNAVATVAAPGNSCGGGGGAAAGPGPGPGSVGRLGEQGTGAVAAPAPPAQPAGRGAGLRPVPAPPPQVAMGASASSQYWQAKRSQNGGVGPQAEADGAGMSRLEQLAALQKKRQAGPTVAVAGQEPNRREGGLRWQDETAPDAESGTASPQRLRISDASGSQQQQQSRQQQQQHCVRLGDPEGAARNVVHKKSGGRGSSRKWASFDEHAQDGEGAAGAEAAAAAAAQPQRRQSRHDHAHGHGQGDAGSPPRKHLEGQSFIKHLEPPPPGRHIHKARSGGGGGGRDLNQGQDQPLAPRPPLMARTSDVTDFDVDEVLNSFSPAVAAEQEPPQQWAGSRPQPPGAAPPRGAGTGQAPQHKRSIRAVQSDFTSMRVNDVADGVTDLTGRVLSLPLPASRPSGAGGPPGQAPAAQAQSTVTSAPVTISRFARMGANLLGQQGTQDGSGAASAPVTMVAGGGCAAAGGGGNGYRVSGLGAAGASPPAAAAFGAASGPAGGLSPARRPRRSNPSFDGAAPPGPIALSGPLGDVGGGGGGPGAARVPMGQAAAPPRISAPGTGDSPLVLPALRPTSGGSGGGGGGNGAGNSILNAPPAVAAVGRSRFGAAQHQQFQQEVARTSQQPVAPSQRDYESDSALSKPSAAVRYSCNGASGGGAGGGGGGGARDAYRQTLASTTGFDGGGGGGGGGGGAFGAAAARSRLGQVGA
ncbi:hypothetical protein PLESTB_000347600 [Pleodorina starrii]|uniref:Uncharacterized protein n=1 Tax=Pleodorina starrii TaxID=330485 RepID=A0A9W6BDI1_9CHLO|nr:hypothetical protein PLESTB_000347600 [Pleodorina starrii]